MLRSETRPQTRTSVAAPSLHRSVFTFIVIQSLSTSVNVVKYGAISDPMTSCNGCVSMIGAQYDARCGLPSNIMLIRGRPKARVLCPEQNVAAIASPGDTYANSLERKTEESAMSDPSCTRGRIIRRTTAELKSNPIPLANALENAFQTIPRRTTYMWNENDK